MRWTCMSHSPGSTDIPSVEITSAPAGTASEPTWPTAVMRSPSTRMTLFLIGTPPNPSINVPPTSANVRPFTCGGACSMGVTAPSTASPVRTVTSAAAKQPPRTLDPGPWTPGPRPDILAPGRMSIFPGIRPRRPAARQLHDELRAAEGAAPSVANLMPQLLQRAPNGVSNRRLENDASSRHVAEPGSIRRLLHIHPEEQDVQKHLHVSLRLHRTAHDAECEIGFVAGGIARHTSRLRRLCHKRRDDGVEGTLLRPHGIRAAFLHREADAAIVQQDAGAGHHDAAAEVVVDRVDERDHVPL